MKVLVGFFTTESNTHIPEIATIANYDIGFGEECVRKCNVKDVFDDYGIETIGAIYANAHGAGGIERNAFDYIESCFVNAVKEHLQEIDGIYLHLHGASEVLGLGSGDHHILAEIRKITGPYLPIAVSCDPHGNLTKEYVEQCTILRSFRESPHTDADQTKKKVAKMLCDLLNNRQNIRPVYRKLPLILGGEQSVSTDEPVASINRFMDEMEKDPRVLSASWHVGYLRHDCDCAGCGVVVVPKTGNDIAYCTQKCNELYDYIWNKRHEFHYTGVTASPDDALTMVLNFNGKPAFLTDSGDNVTSGATGWNTVVLRQFLNIKNLKKSVLIANICDPKAMDLLKDEPIGKEVSLSVGMNYDKNSLPTPVTGTIAAKGRQFGNMWSGKDKVWGQITVLKLKDIPVTLCLATSRNTMCELHQFEEIGIDPRNYDIVVVKQGYIFPEMKKIAKMVVMSLTDGSTPQDTRAIDFKRILRPMYPIDNI